MNTRERYENDAREKGIPEYMIDGVVEHVMVGRGTGNFLTSLFENDLMKRSFGSPRSSVEQSDCRSLSPIEPR